ncbi:conserved hypothetical protein [Roseovarius sp. EC-HK134]|uniref:hypothetical protein n=1 Tax=unclassified Roseovarius TaxID=2614913 RepID=UPI00125B0FFA|nr:MULTISPECIES: hypothetical protein [unclassified Roseovarius]VVT33602.1 conserved hypothetical protein [Roseovarius sp. EC-HK134]VVT33734.1 conserved hypothetical protein [Roseovarius sp. EC-SD190]
MNAPVTSVDSYRMQDHSSLQAQLTVSQIMTGREAFICALEGQSIDEAFQDVPDIYDILPVVDGDDPRDITAEVIGTIDRREVLPAQMRQKVLSQMNDYTGDAITETLPLLDFASAGRVDDLTLVTNGGGSQVCGLVTIYDLQRLPVRIALFAALTDLEEDIACLLDRLAPEPSEWVGLVYDPKGKIAAEIQTGLQRAANRDNLGSPVLTLSFGVKLALLEGLKRHGRLAGLHVPSLREIRNIRNDIAHGTPFENIDVVPKAARDLRDLHALVRKVIERKA